MSNSSRGRQLADEHADLMTEMGVRERRVLDALAAGRWPDAEIEALLGYLRYEVLDQAVHEERLLYPLTPAGFADPRIQHLVSDHVRLRDTADELAAAARAVEGERDAERVVAVLAELRTRLADHVRSEQEVLSPVTAGVESIRQPFRSHEWFSLTEGPVLDMDRLPRDFAHSAVMERLARMQPGERTELRSSTTLEILFGLLTRSGLAADYGWAYEQEGPDRWIAQVTRRPDPS